MTDRTSWSRLKNLDAVGSGYLGSWSRAVTMQAERVLDADRGHLDRQVDSYQFVHALRQVHRAAAMVAAALGGEAGTRARAALDRFATKVPDAKDARDVLDHFDDYASGVGNLSHPNTRKLQRVATEEAAREFTFYFEIRSDGHYIVHLGRLQIDVQQAHAASEELVGEILEAQGMVPVDEADALASISLGDHTNVKSVGFGFTLGYASLISPTKFGGA